MSAYDYILGADTANMQAGGESFFSSVGNALTKGTAGAALSGVYGILNTGVDLSNKVFDRQIERFDTAETLSKVDSSWADYYTANKDVIDTVGFVAGSLLPGTLAVKGLKLLQTGNSAGAIGKVLGYTTRMESHYLNKALKELAVEGGTVFTQINKAKAASIAWGVADNVLTTAAFEIGVAASMSASPLLEGKSLSDMSHDIVVNAAFGGVVGGAIGGIMTNKLVKDAGKLIDTKQRGFDRLADIGQLNISAGDNAYSIVDAVMQLPREALDTTIKLTHGRKGIRDTLDVTGLMDKSLKNTVSKGVLKFEGTLTNIVKEDTTVGAPFARSLVKHLQQGLEAGADDQTIRSVLEDKLLNLRSVTAIGSRPLDLSGELRYLDPVGDISVKGAAVFSNTPKIDDLIVTKNSEPVKQAIYRVIGDENNAKMGTLGADAATEAEAFKIGYDLVLDPATRQVSVNPFSKIYARAEDDAATLAPMFYNTTTMQTSFDVVPTIADIATAAKGEGALAINIGGVQSGNKAFVFTTKDYFPPADSLEATARMAWAAKLPKVYGTVSSDDIAVLEALRTNPSIADPGLRIKDVVTGERRALNEIQDFSTYVYTRKFETAINLLEEAGEKADLRDIAYRLNVSGDWMQEAVSNKMSANQLFKHEGWQQNPARFLERENVVLHYDIAAREKAEAFVTGKLAYHARIAEAQAKADDVSAAVLGDDYKLLMNIGQDIAKHADSQNVGAGMFTSSNANYLDQVRSWAQYTGQQAADISVRRGSAALKVIESPAVRILQNPDAAAEVVAAVTKGRLSTDAMALYRDGASGKSMLVDLESYKQVMYKSAAPEFKQVIQLSEDAADFIGAHQMLHAKRIEQQTALAVAQGTPLRWDKDKLYFPPVDTQRVPFFAFVHQREGTLFGSSEVSMITARDAAELKRLAAVVEQDPTLKVVYKANTEEYFKAKGRYDFNRTMNEPVLDSTLRSRGALGDYLPNMTPEALVEDFVQYTQRAETQLVRDAISVKYGQQFAELKALGDTYVDAQTSKFEGLSKLLQRNVTDPFNDTIKLALNVSKRGEFALWHEANEFVDALGTKAWRGISSSVLDAKGGKISWEVANEKLQQFGLGAHFKSEDAFLVAQTAPDRNLIKTAVNKANMLLANGMLRLDFANSLLNIVSTPIALGMEVSSIRHSLRNDPEMLKLFNTNLTQAVPGTQTTIPSTSKLVYNAINNMFGETGKQLDDRFRSIGTVKGQRAMFHQMMDDLSLVPNMVPSKYAAKVDEWVEKGARMTFNTQSEDFTRFVASDVMRQITEPVVQAGKMSVQEQNAFITIFVNRVQGNYVASQRPILFQGTLGSAIGLFQTYQFNMFQQLYRHIENRDMKTLAVAAGLQGTLFGLNGMPFFQAINTHLLGNAAMNSKHEDMYSFATKAVGKEWGDWMMYGTASAMPLFPEQAPALWTRGDLNPRSIALIPVSPLDVPAVQASMKVVNAVLGMAKQVSQGSDMTDAMLFGLEHNGLNRPLAGLAQVLKGSSTTTKGDLISASSDWASIATASRLLGAKPMDESIALTAMYRSSAYKAVDKQRVDSLGTTIKQKLMNNQSLTEEDWVDFQGKYAAAGGRVQGFTQAVQRWDKKANVSVVNEVMRHSQTQAGQRMLGVMGGDMLPDYRTPEEQE